MHLGIQEWPDDTWNTVAIGLKWKRINLIWTCKIVWIANCCVPRVLYWNSEWDLPLKLLLKLYPEIQNKTEIKMLYKLAVLSIWVLWTTKTNSIMSLVDGKKPCSNSSSVHKRPVVFDMSYMCSFTLIRLPVIPEWYLGDSDSQNNGNLKVSNRIYCQLPNYHTGSESPRYHWMSNTSLLHYDLITERLVYSR